MKSWFVIKCCALVSVVHIGLSVLAVYACLGLDHYEVRHIRNCYSFYDE